MKQIFYRVDNKKKRREYTIYAVAFFVSILIDMCAANYRDRVFWGSEYIIPMAIIMSSIIILFSLYKLLYILANQLDFNAYVIDEGTGEFYKVGVYPRNRFFFPSTEEFLLDTNYFCNLLSEKGSLKQKLNTASNIPIGRSRKYETQGFGVIGEMLNLYNEKFLLKHLNNPKKLLAYKVTKVYSFDEDEVRYTIMCDVLKNNGKVLDNVRMNIKKVYDKNGKLKVQLKRLI